MYSLCDRKSCHFTAFVSPEYYFQRPGCVSNGDIVREISTMSLRRTVRMYLKTPGIVLDSKIILPLKHMKAIQHCSCNTIKIIHVLIK